jgi:hypothetical protein
MDCDVAVVVGIASHPLHNAKSARGTDTIRTVGVDGGTRRMKNVSRLNF